MTVGMSFSEKSVIMSTLTARFNGVIVGRPNRLVLSPSTTKTDFERFVLLCKQNVLESVQSLLVVFLLGPKEFSLTYVIPHFADCDRYLVR